MGVLASGSNDEPKEIYELTPKKRFLFQTAAYDFWADNYVKHVDQMGAYLYTSVINVTKDKRHVVTDIYAPIDAVTDFEPEHTLETFQQVIDEHAEMQDELREKFADEIAKRVKTTKTEKVVGYQ